MIPKIRNAVVHGEIHLPSDDPMLLTQDLFEAQLETGVILDVGWFPEHDPHGEYVITAFVDPDHLLCEPFVTADPNEALAILDQWADRFSQPQSSISHLRGGE